ncbi:hypothetical protein GRX01_02330 [Halobaculum sp. WSA2]|uniref:CARDB protein n=1 Tax=Halobaculum saliterrae TaxID=2073113 RepID=A0A6B0SRL5_9EURY|nr:hypothetical protein [Halobaculum saliterrae]MXR40196.1 hypothetical protein [Halobaculum saliterrae]
MTSLNAVISIKLALLLVVVTSVGTATAVTVLDRNPDPIVPVRGDISGSTDLTVDAQRLTYDGINVTGVTVTVNNTGTTDHTGAVHLALKNGSTTVASSTVTGEQFAAETTTNTTIDLGSDYAVSDVDRVEVTIERTDPS